MNKRSPVGITMQPRERRHALAQLTVGDPVRVFSWEEGVLVASRMSWVAEIGEQLVFIGSRNTRTVGTYEKATGAAVGEGGRFTTWIEPADEAAQQLTRELKAIIREDKRERERRVQELAQE